MGLQITVLNCLDQWSFWNSSRLYLCFVKNVEPCLWPAK